MDAACINASSDPRRENFIAPDNPWTHCVDKLGKKRGGYKEKIGKDQDHKTGIAFVPRPKQQATGFGLYFKLCCSMAREDKSHSLAFAYLGERYNSN
jgi:hypothetical protein